MFRFILFVLLLFIGARSEPLLPSVAGKLNQVIFVYPKDAQSERDLHVCPENTACNIIHKRFWLPPLVERLCRCPQRHECKATWQEKPDNYTMSLDNRSQLKFCSDLSDLPQCTIRKTAIRLVTNLGNTTNNASTSLKNRYGHKSIKNTEHRNVSSLCHCSEPHYWKLRGNATKYFEKAGFLYRFYNCSKLKKCNPLDFCGYTRTDTYSTFYRCSCPKEHMCISKDKVTHKIDEMLYNGYGYKSFCLPSKKVI